VHVTPEDLERFGDEEQVRAAWDEGRLRDEQFARRFRNDRAVPR